MKMIVRLSILLLLAAFFLGGCAKDLKPLPSRDTLMQLDGKKCSRSKEVISFEPTVTKENGIEIWTYHGKPTSKSNTMVALLSAGFHDGYSNLFKFHCLGGRINNITYLEDHFNDPGGAPPPFARQSSSNSGQVASSGAGGSVEVTPAKERDAKESTVKEEKKEPNKKPANKKKKAKKATK